MTEVLPDPTRVTARRALTRERLMAAALTVFADRGIVGASVEEICETAGFTRGAFYSNFADKDALVLALIVAGCETAYAEAEQAIARSESAPTDMSINERISYVLDEFEGTGSRGQQVLAQQQMLLYAARQPSLREPYLRYVDASAERLARLIADALASVGLEFTLDFAEAIELLVAVHDHVQMQALFTGRPDFGLLRHLVIAITRPA